MKTSLLLIYALYVTSLLSPAQTAPVTMTTEGWSQILQMANVSGDRNSISESLRAAGHRMATAAAEAERLQHRNQESHITPEQKEQILLITTILFWYSTDIRKDFSNQQDKAFWQEDRLKAAKFFRDMQTQYPNQMAGSWTTFLECCKLLGLPSANQPH